MTKASFRWQLSAIAAVSFSVACLLVPVASADIIGVQNATGPCSPNELTLGGGTICSGNTTAFSLTALENGTESLQAEGTPTSLVYLVVNDTGSRSFTLTFNGLLASNQFLACQENGDFAGDSCSISGALGTVGTGTDYGPPTGETGYWNPDATVTLAGPSSGTFDIAVSLRTGDSGTLKPGTIGRLPVIAMPESDRTLALLATDLSPLVLFGLVGFLRKRHRSEEGAY